MGGNPLPCFTAATLSAPMAPTPSLRLPAVDPPNENDWPPRVPTPLGRLLPKGERVSEASWGLLSAVLALLDALAKSPLDPTGPMLLRPLVGVEAALLAPLMRPQRPVPELKALPLIEVLVAPALYRMPSCRSNISW